MAATDFKVKLLPWQEKVWQNAQNGNDRFQVIAAGRRCGKTEYAAYRLIFAALMNPRGETWYVGPTQGQARDNIWDKIQEIGREVIKSSHINNLQITLINGKKISLKGSDRPDTLRGSFLNLLVLDEFADMKPETWDEILRPALSDLRAPAVFIGTPKGRNHFYDLYTKAGLGALGSEWAAYHFTTYDNPFIDVAEIEAAKATMSSFAFRQEFMASFEARGSEAFKDDWVKFNSEEPKGGEYLIAADLAGFEIAGKKKSSKRDNNAFAIVKVGEFQDEHGPYNWWVKNIMYGRWTLDETARRLFSAVEFNQPTGVGIEKGIAQQAVLSPLQDLQRRHNRYFRVQELTHGNKNKVDRVIWALQGRFENGNIRLNEGEWNTQFLDELFQFPDPMTNDDGPDALAYIDQLATLTYRAEWEYDTFEPLDEDTGW